MNIISDLLDGVKKAQAEKDYKRATELINEINSFFKKIQLNLKVIGREIKECSDILRSNEIVIKTGYKVPSLNEWERINSYKKPGIKKRLAWELNLLFQSECRKKKIKAELPLLQPMITVFSYRKRLIRDSDNFCLKALKDALVRAKILKDDSMKDLTEGEHRQIRIKDSETPWTEIKIEWV